MPKVKLSQTDKDYAWRHMMPKKQATQKVPALEEDRRRQQHRLYGNALAELAVCKHLKISYACANLNGQPFGIVYSGKNSVPHKIRIKCCHSQSSRNDVWTITDAQLDDYLFIWFARGTSDYDICGWTTAQILRKIGVEGRKRRSITYTIENRRLFKPGEWAKYLENPTQFMAEHKLLRNRR